MITKGPHAHNKMQPQTRVPRPIVMSRVRRIFYLLMGTFSLLSLFFILGCIIWIDYKSIYQSGLLGIMHILTGIIIGVYITSEVTEHWRYADSPNEAQMERDRHRNRRGNANFKRAGSTMALVAVLAIILSSVYVYNQMRILISECPKYTADSSSVNPSVVYMQLTYRHQPTGEYYAKQNTLILRYNTTSQSIIRKTRDSNPNVVNYDRWFVQNELHSLSYNIQNTQHPLPPPLCINRTDEMLFSFIENEVAHLLYKNLDARLSSKSIRIADKHYTQANTDEEDDMDHYHHMNRICRHEQPFVIVLIIFILVWDIIAVCLIAFCVYIIRTPLTDDGLPVAATMKKQAPQQQQQQTVNAYYNGTDGQYYR